MAQSQLKNYQSWSALNTTPDTFNLDAGVYGLTLAATVWGTAALQRVFPGGILVTVLTAFAANGYATVQLPAGRYQLTAAGITALTGELALIAHGSG